MTGKRIFVGMLLTLVVVALLALGGAAIYQAGFTQGAMANLTLPEGGEFPVMPHSGVPLGYMPLGWHAGPRVGLLGLFPLLCFGGFFFLVLMCGFGFRKRAWRHYGPGWHEHWKHYGPPPWGSGKPPWAETQAQTESDIPSMETEETEK